MELMECLITHKKSHAFTFFAIWVNLLFTYGCRTNWQAIRQDHAMQHSEQVQEETQDILQHYPDGLDLATCITLSRERNTRLLASQITAKVAQMDRKAAFGAFLPQIQVTYNSLWLSKDPLVRVGDSALALQEKSVHDFSAMFVQPLFAPNAWLLYRSARRSADIATLAQERTEQMVELAVVNAFHQYGALSEYLAMVDTDIEAARQLLHETESLRETGYVTEAELAGVQVLLKEHKRVHDLTCRAMQLTYSQLMQLMNLWPQNKIQLLANTLLAANSAHYMIELPGMECHEVTAKEMTDTPIETWMFHALVARKEMKIQDQTVALRKNETLRALAMFIPNLTSYASYYKTSDSYTVNQAYWGGGLQAVLSSFIGFRDVASYLKARQEVKGAYVEREEMAMMILLQVIEASNNLCDASAALAITEEAKDAAGKVMSVAEARFRADLSPLSQLLQTRAAYSQAVMRNNSAAYANALATHAFINVLGGYIECADIVLQGKE